MSMPGTFVVLRKSRVDDHSPHCHCHFHLLSSVLELEIELAKEMRHSIQHCCYIVVN